MHRIGRTARADRDGRAVTFVSNEDFSRLARIERLLEKEVPKLDVPAEFGESPVFAKSGRRGSGLRNGRNNKKAGHNSRNKCAGRNDKSGQSDGAADNCGGVKNNDRADAKAKPRHRNRRPKPQQRKE